MCTRSCHEMRPRRRSNCVTTGDTPTSVACRCQQHSILGRMLREQGCCREEKAISQLAEPEFAARVTAACRGQPEVLPSVARKPAAEQHKRAPRTRREPTKSGGQADLPTFPSLPFALCIGGMTLLSSLQRASPDDVSTSCRSSWAPSGAEATQLHPRRRRMTKVPSQKSILQSPTCHQMGSKRTRALKLTTLCQKVSRSSVYDLLKNASSFKIYFPRQSY